MTVSNLAYDDIITETWTDSVTTDVNNATSAISGINSTLSSHTSSISTLNTAIANFNQWTSYAPTSWGMTVGNGTKTGRYLRIGDLVFFGVTMVLGSTSAISGTIQFSLPVTAASTEVGSQMNADFTDTSGSNIFKGMVTTSTTVASLFACGSGGSYVNYVGTSSTIPFTWADTDVIELSGWYLAA